MSLIRRIALGAASLLLCVSAADAEPVQFKFTGTVTYGGNLADVGSRIVGIFGYDTKTKVPSTLPGYASYQIPAPNVLSAAVNGHAIVANFLDVTVWDNYGGNVEDMVEVAGGPLLVNDMAYLNGSFGFRLASKPGNTRVLTSTKLPQHYNVRAFNAGPTLNYGWLQSDGGPDGQLLQFTIDSIAAQDCGR